MSVNIRPLKSVRAVSVLINAVIRVAIISIPHKITAVNAAIRLNFFIMGIPFLFHIDISVT